jgi:acetoin utilization deacetylase AcuC-like enzyme
MVHSPYDVAWYDSQQFSLHINRETHPECPERLDSIRAELQRKNLDSRLRLEPPTAVDIELLKKIHTPAHVRRVQAACAEGPTLLDADTGVVEASFEAARLAAGAVVDAVSFVLGGDNRRAFCSPRPPGHHAVPDRAMGFCLFNNIAVGAQAALEAPGVDRVAILDWDVHHGNGTQEIFWERDDVFFASVHQYPFYPGSGAATERGRARGEGFTLNCPQAAGAGDGDLLRAWTETIAPALERFEPDLLLISAGFDADYRDPLGGMSVTPQGFEALSRAVLEWSEACCEGRVVSTLEGGYNVAALGEDVAIHVETLLG